MRASPAGRPAMAAQLTRVNTTFSTIGGGGGERPGARGVCGDLGTVFTLVDPLWHRLGARTTHTPTCAHALAEGTPARALTRHPAHQPAGRPVAVPLAKNSGCDDDSHGENICGACVGDTIIIVYYCGTLPLKVP